MSMLSEVLEVPLPRLSDSMEEGTILAWLVEDGALVTRGQEIVEVETDKATMPYEAERDGVLHIAVGAGETVAVGATIARIAPEGVAVEATRTSALAAAPPAPAAQRQPTTALRSTLRVSASPLARRIANELNVDLAALVGSGPNGRVVKRDVLAASASAQASPAMATAPATNGAPEASSSSQAHAAPAQPPAPGSSRIALTRLQQTVARRMTEAAQAPTFVLDVEVEMDAAVAFRARLKELLGDSGRPVPTLGDFVIKASALALRDHPRANGAYRGDEVELFDAVNVGVAVAAPGALLVPTVHDADQRSLGQIASDVKRLASRAREGTLVPHELDGATFTVSNLGMFGIDAFTAVLNPPQAAILAVGAVRERPFARAGQLVVAHTMAARLTCDHRILNGADGAALLARIRELLQTPELLAL
jgi:pyruvate dehydrogenase E2 component (dihydrolipoamide acetyltransferase)